MVLFCIVCLTSSNPDNPRIWCYIDSLKYVNQSSYGNELVCNFWQQRWQQNDPHRTLPLPFAPLCMELHSLCGWSLWWQSTIGTPMLWCSTKFTGCPVEQFTIVNMIMSKLQTISKLIKLKCDTLIKTFDYLYSDIGRLFTPDLTFLIRTLSIWYLHDTWVWVSIIVSWHWNQRHIKSC